MHIKDRVIMGPIKNQLPRVQNLGDVVGLSKASWVQSHWVPFPGCNRDLGRRASSALPCLSGQEAGQLE